MKESPEAVSRERRAGQGMVEFALVLPVLLLIVWGIFEFGRILFIYSEISNAAREAVRYGLARGDLSGDPHWFDCAGIRDAGRATSVLAQLQDGDFQISYDDGQNVFGTCEAPEEIRFGDRLLITVTHQVTPLVLFTGAGPFQMQFVTARTIPLQGIPTSGIAGGAGRCQLAPPDMSVDFEPYCSTDVDGKPEVQFSWSSVAGAFGYSLYQETVTDTLATDLGPDPPLQYPLPDDTYIGVPDGGLYYVRPYDSAGLECVFSNSVQVTAADCVPILDAPILVYDHLSPCQGYFSWDIVGGAVGYRLYYNDTFLIGESLDLRFPIAATETITVFTGSYTVRAYDDAGEGPDSDAVDISGCDPTGAPDAPESLKYVPAAAGGTCRGYFTWDAVFGATEYGLWYDGAVITDSIGITTDRYPVTSTTYFKDGSYTVRAGNVQGWSGDSIPVIRAAGCLGGAGEGEITYYLHSSGCSDGDAPPPLLMNTIDPPCGSLPNYNSTSGSSPGRELTRGGDTPPEADPLKFLEWRADLANELTIVSGTVTVTLWARNLENQAIPASVSLYDFDGSTWSLIASAGTSWDKKADGGDSWTERSLYLTVAAGYTLPAGDRLVVWLLVTSPGHKTLHFAYDASGYWARIEFTGVWGE